MEERKLEKLEDHRDQLQRGLLRLREQLHDNMVVMIELREAQLRANPQNNHH